MSAPFFRSLKVLAFAASLGGGPIAVSVVRQESGTVLRVGELSALGREVQRIEIPRESAGLEVLLEIASPDSLDLDLRVYDVEPGEGFVRPVCTSDGISAVEACRIPRPASGVVWALVESVSKGKSTAYRLSADFLSSMDLNLQTAEFLRPNAGPVALVEQRGSFRFGLDAGQVGIVLLEGAPRRVIVEPVEGGHPEPSRMRRATTEGSYVPIGTPFQGSPVLLAGLDRPVEFLITVEATGSQSGYQRSRLSIRTGEKDRDGEYLLPFSLEDVEPKPLAVGGREGRRSGRVSAGEKIVYRLSERTGPAEAVLETPEGTNLDIALCNQYGQVLSIGDAMVFIEPERETWGGRAAQKQVRGPDWPPDELYLVVFPSPFASPRGAGEFRVVVHPPHAAK